MHKAGMLPRGLSVPHSPWRLQIGEPRDGRVLDTDKEYRSTPPTDAIIRGSLLKQTPSRHSFLSASKCELVCGSALFFPGPLYRMARRQKPQGRRAGAVSVQIGHTSSHLFHWFPKSEIHSKRLQGRL